MIEIRHVLPDEIEIHFFACQTCEEKWWDRDGQTVELRDVLDLARKTRR